MTTPHDDHQALDERVRTHMRIHGLGPDQYAEALDAVVAHDELGQEPCRPADALPTTEQTGSVFDSLVRANLLAERHRDVFTRHYPANARRCEADSAVFAELVEFARRVVDGVGADSRDAGDGGDRDDDLEALEQQVQRHADDRGVDWWTVAAVLTGDSTLAPRPMGPVLGDEDQVARQLARQHAIDYVDAAQFAELERQLEAHRADAYALDVDAGIELRQQRDEFLERAKAAESERRRGALSLERRRSQRAGEHAHGRIPGVADRSDARVT
jgi:hypothetical protein